jgi:hypothetical protein
MAQVPAANTHWYLPSCCEQMNAMHEWYALTSLSNAFVRHTCVQRVHAQSTCPALPTNLLAALFGDADGAVHRLSAAHGDILGQQVGQ